MEIPASSAPKDFGASLRIAREGRGLTLQQIAEATKISRGVLQAVEQNDIARLPGSVYNRSFVRTYAREVGLDPAATVDAFLDAFPEQRPDEIEKPRDEPGGRERVVSQRNIDRTVVSLALILVSVFGFLLFFGLRESRDTDVDSPVPFAQEVEVAPMEPSREPESEAPAGPQPPSATLPSAIPPPPMTEAATIVGPLTIEIYPTGPCWVSLTVDGQRVFARVLHLGEREVYEARDQIILKVGDAGVFYFSINQQPGRSLGARGEVVTVEIDRANYRSFLTG
jgi:transcriptional regulator with XRE-family HTH domain